MADYYQKKGFTIIELLVVIAIIGLLSTIVLVSVDSARKKARDAERLKETQQMATAQNLYFETYGKYKGCEIISPFSQCCSHDTPYDCVSATYPTSIGSFMNMPKDPAGVGDLFYKLIQLSPDNFCLIAHLEAQVKSVYFSNKGNGVVDGYSHFCPNWP